MPRYAVLGATSWGLTLAHLLCRGGAEVTLLVRDRDEANRLQTERGIPRLPELVLPDSVHVAVQAEWSGGDGLVAAVPAQSLRTALGGVALPRDIPLLSAAKGIEHGTLLRMSEVAIELGWPSELVGVISGPNLAHEVARGLPAASVIAAASEDTAAAWQSALSTGAFRCYRSRDVVGTELGGALKNIIAIAAGAAAGLDLGANAIAAIMTRGLAEMTRLGVALGADPATFLGLAGIGDLAATCYSPLSRNHRLGELLARGATPAEALAQIAETVEGAATTPVALQLGHRVGVELPIAEQVGAVLDGTSTVGQAMVSLLSRALRSEVEPLSGW
ncbi:MAG: NAD(P)H-dependent glycerol-3-phosphate dehydrogenase [Dehalococcoidia bacterium]